MSTKHRRKPYMPDSDAGKKTWMDRFITQLETDPERYGFDDPYMFEYYQRTIRTFIKAVEAVQSPATCTPGAVKEKNRARKEAVRMCRDFAMQLKWDTTLSNEEKIALGLHIDEAPPEDAKLPEGEVSGALGFPRLAVESSPSGGHVIRYFNVTSKSKAKPKGVSHLLLFGAIGEKPKRSRTHARLLGAYTKRPFEIIYPMDCGLEGLYVTYYARWLTTRGEMSPWSLGVSKIIGETQTSLRESAFGHLFGKEGFIDAVPGVPGVPGVAALPDAVQVEAEAPPMLESASVEDSGSDDLFAALEAKMLEAVRVRLLDAA